MNKQGTPAGHDARDDELQSLREQVEHHQAVITALVKRSGGRVFLDELELESVVGYGIKMDMDDDGILLRATDPSVQLEVSPAFVHATPTSLQ